MSTLALMLAVRDYLRDRPDLGLNKDNCEITDRGEPFPIAGNLFVSVWYGSWRDRSSNGESLDTDHAVNVTVSLRYTGPRDRVGAELIAKESTGLVAYCEKLVAVLHMDPVNDKEGVPQTAMETIMNRANDYLNKWAGRAVNGIIEPLQFLDGGQPQRQPGSWWGAKVEGFAGMSQTLSFGKANRVQTIESQT